MAARGRPGSERCSYSPPDHINSGPAVPGRNYRNCSDESARPADLLHGGWRREDADRLFPLGCGASFLRREPDVGTMVRHLKITKMIRLANGAGGVVENSPVQLRTRGGAGWQISLSTCCRCLRLGWRWSILTTRFWRQSRGRSEFHAYY